MADSPVDQLALALEAHQRLVEGTREGQWADPSPCSDWTVRDLVAHVVGGNRLFAAILQREPTSSTEELERRRGLDVLGEDPAAAHRDSAEALLASFRRPGVLQEMVSVPIGTVPGIAALQLRVVEALVHGWDLARGTGQALEAPEDVVEQALAFSQARLSDLPPGRTPFAAPQPVAADAEPLDRLAALLGRPVTPAAAGA